MSYLVKHADGETALVDDLEHYAGPDWTVIAEEVDPSVYLAIAAKGVPLHEREGLLAPDLERARADRWAAIKAVRDQKVRVAPTPLGTFDSDEIGRSNINGQVTAILALGADAPGEIVWKMHDNSFATFTPQQFVQAGLLVSQHIASVYATSWQLEQALNAADTLDEIEAVEWPAA